MHWISYLHLTVKVRPHAKRDDDFVTVSTKGGAFETPMMKALETGALWDGPRQEHSLSHYQCAWLQSREMAYWLKDHGVPVVFNESEDT